MPNPAGAREASNHAATHANAAKSIATGHQDPHVQPLVQAINELAEAVLNLADGINFLVE